MSKVLIALTILGAITLGASIYKFSHNLSLADSIKPVNDEITSVNDSIKDVYAQWKLKYEKQGAYKSSVEDDYRYNVFEKNYKLIQESNANPNHTFQLELNSFADTSSEEFAKIYLTHKDSKLDKSKVKPIESYQSVDDDEEVDWTTTGAVSGVKDQGHCGSCWSFSTTGALEGLNYIKNGTVESFSEQQLVDCDKGSLWPFYLPNMGCNGGNMTWAMRYTSIRGLMREEDYPYHAERGTCKYDSSKVVFKNVTYHSVQKGCNSCLKSQVKKQPVSVGVDGSSIQFYKSGVYNGKCNVTINHGVLAVGYGTDSEQGMYWKVKNSWGQSWGENGYYRLERTNSIGFGKCGIATRAAYPA